jgi:hypothetical protein
MKTRSPVVLLFSAAGLAFTACGTTGSTVGRSTPPAQLADATSGYTTAGGDILSGSFGHEAVGASLINLTQDDKGRQARAQAEYDYRSYLVWKSSQRSE